MSIIDDLVPELVGLPEADIRARIETYLDKQARDMAAVVLGLALSDIDLTPEQRSLIVDRAVALQGDLRAEFAELKAAELAGAQPTTLARF